MKKERKITIIGGGIIGLFSAYYLVKAGYKVEIIDQSDGVDGCSHGNAGMVVPSHFIPLAAPGMLEKGIKWMFDAESPFYVKPRLNWDLVRWGYQFYKSATQKKVNEAIPALRDFGLLSKQLYHDVAQENAFSFNYEEKGLLMLCKSHETWEEEAKVAEIANQIGIKAHVVGSSEIQKLEPTAGVDALGGVFYSGDAHLSPNLLVKQLRSYLEKEGVVFMFTTQVEDVVVSNQEISSLVLRKGEESTLHSVQELVVAGGAWSSTLAKKMNFFMPLQAGKGYSVSLSQKEAQRIQIPSILLEARVAVTPMGEETIRFGGTMEIGGAPNEIDMRRVKGIIQSIPKYYRNYSISMPKKEEVWHGLRPCAPDGLPYVGKLKTLKNVIIASGHAMMGLSLAPATGLIVSELIEDKKPSIELELYQPERFY